jgi:hypothetical protein
MFNGTKLIETVYVRISKLGRVHSYSRKKTVAMLVCDSCGVEFERELKKMRSNRMNNNFFHCCSNCDAKRFAQRKGIERKKIWDMPAGIDLPVSRF